MTDRPTNQLAEGQWAVFLSDWTGTYDAEAAPIQRITPKTVYAAVHSKQQHRKDDVIGCADEASARRLADQFTSAKAELRRQEQAALIAYRKAIAALRQKEQQ